MIWEVYNFQSVFAVWTILQFIDCLCPLTQELQSQNQPGSRVKKGICAAATFQLEGIVYPLSILVTIWVSIFQDLDWDMVWAHHMLALNPKCHIPNQSIPELVDNSWLMASLSILQHFHRCPSIHYRGWEVIATSMVWTLKSQWELVGYWVEGLKVSMFDFCERFQSETGQKGQSLTFEFHI